MPLKIKGVGPKEVEGEHRQGEWRRLPPKP